GDLDGAAELNMLSADEGRRRKDPGTLPNAELNLGDIFLARGDLALAGEMFDRVERFARDPTTSAWMRFRYSIRLASSQGELARGDLGAAASHARRCLDLATRTNARKNLVKAWRLAGEAACAAGRWEDAGRALQEARTIAEEIGNPAQLWRTYSALAAFHAGHGDKEAARRAAADAVRVVDGVLAALPDESLRESLNRLPLVREARARARRAT